MVSTRFITFALLTLAAAAPRPAASQEAGDLFIVLLTELVGRDGAAPFYSGVVSWTNKEGDSTETVSAYVTKSQTMTPSSPVLKAQVECDGTYVDRGASRIIYGPGLIEMSLGQGRNDKYSIRVACPNATTPGEPADFRHSYDTYEQPGGTVELTADLKRAKLPRVLEGSRSEPYDNGGFVTMTWKLCTHGCPPPPRPKKPPAGGPPSPP